jgi:hypothetical protein
MMPVEAEVVDDVKQPRPHDCERHDKYQHGNHVIACDAALA